LPYKNLPNKEMIQRAPLRAGYGFDQYNRPVVPVLLEDFDGAFLLRESRDALWDRFYTAAPQRRRRSVERYKIAKRAGERSPSANFVTVFSLIPLEEAELRRRFSTGPKEPKSTALSIVDEAIIVAFRRHTLLPLDDCLYALQPMLPHLMRSPLHRCLQRHGISRLPEVEGTKPSRKSFKTPERLIDHL
jgi:hypothetical protein